MTFLVNWCRRHLAWQELLGTLVLFVAGGALWWFGGALTAAAQVVLWLALALCAAVLLRRGWLKLFGPVLFYDMVRAARRGRYILARCAYAALLLLFLWSTYNTSAYRYGFYSRSATPLWVNADLAQSFFETLMIVQLVAVLLLTPAYVAGAIADEKNCKTLEFLLATDLDSREIVLSKFVSRLANLAIFILTGLPIISFLQFLGGIDPNLVLA